MKTFFEGERGDSQASAAVTSDRPQAPSQALARIAVYDSLAASPRCEDVVGGDSRGFIETLAARVYELAREQGGRVPYTLIREIAENSIHAGFNEVIVTILDGGNTIRFSDQGPGIADKDRAFLPGYSTASLEMKRVIRGVGSGLPIVKECLSFSDGSISVEDNLGSGTVVTLRVDPPSREPEPDPEPEPAGPEPHAAPRLSTRQKQVLSLVLELAAVGPSSVSSELGVAPSTAYRDLAQLEEAGLLAKDGFGKRVLTEDGVSFLDDMFK